MKIRYTFPQRLLALALTLFMVIGLLPSFTLGVTAVGGDTRVSDPSTLNEWEAYFGPTVMSTEFAGGVWTDKSVFTDADKFRAEITMDDPDNNFLIALSAIAANQQIIGYSSAPMDVMLVLDVSGSMDSNSKDTAMINAANQAIERLLSQNNNNRIGVVLYSGNTDTKQNAGTNTATVILPLDHYTTTATINIGTEDKTNMIPAYLSLTNNNVSVANGVLNSVNAAVDTGSKSVSGGTYIQNGLYQAWGEFSKVTDTVVPAGNVQAGTQRTPVMILMSDGQPTLATASYNNVGTSDSTYGNGSESSTTNQTVFLTQLTAAFVKGKMEAHYGTTAKFYTLGLGTGSSSHATAVLNPSTSNDTLNNYWNNFLTGTADESGNVQIIASNQNNQNNKDKDKNNQSWSVYKDSNVKAQNYVDLYKLAANTEDLLAAFSSIVDTIEVESAGHVTMVEEIGEDMSGYITFTDELGALMEVKDVKGLVLGNTLFTGHELAESLQTNSMGTQQNPTAYGDEFIATVQERLGIDSVTDAQTLVMAAYADGQLAFSNNGTPNDESDDTYSNYIGWYSDDDGNYLGFWDKDTGITAEGAPEGATWINKSYGYLGTAGDSDMMHVVVMVCTHITSGMQVVQYKIPASLIPMVTYQVELDGANPESMKSLTRQAADPLRLVYEVGLQSDINEVNIEQKIADMPEGLHYHKNADGTYSFYTNLWGDEEGGHEIDYNDPLGHQVAQSHFHPAVGNDRYYYTEDTPVYVKTGDTYAPYDGTSAPSGNGYYRAYHYYTATGYTTEYLPMSTYALNMAAANGRASDGYWYIPEGAIFQQIDRFHMEKSQNLTSTLEYYDYPVVVDTGDHYDVYAFLGNNGKITVTPAQGIKLTKTVTETVTGAPDTFTFNITLSEVVASPKVTDADGNDYTGTWSVNGKVITVAVKAGETVYITGLPTGVTYTVEEAENHYYSASSTNATGTVAAYTVNAVDFVNTPKGYGSLIVSKDVDHPYTTVPQALTEKEFTINVTLSGADVANKIFRVTGSDSITSVTTDANGSFTVTLKDNESLTVVDLPEGTTFTTTETLDAIAHKGFTMDASRSILTGTIVKNETVQTHVVNVYAPSTPVATIDVSGTKTLVDEAGTFDWEGKSFTIRLEQYDPATGTYTTVDETTVTAGSLDYKFEDALTFNAIGTYIYKVSEVIPSERLEGMSYDATTGRFEVRVTDNDVDGQLEFTVYDFETGEEITGSNNVYTFDKDFTNTHTTDATFVEFTVDKEVADENGTGVTEDGFLFELYEVENGVMAAAAPAYFMRTVLDGNGNGHATFHIPVTEVGSRTFILKETAPADVDKIPGMTYDTAEYTVVVSATAEDGKLVPKVEFFDADGNAITEDELVFTNVIDLEPATLTPSVTKTLEGREPLSNDEFTFKIVETDGSFATEKTGGYSDTVSVGKGTAAFDSITFNNVGTYYFRVTEVAGNKGGMTYDSTVYHMTVNVSVGNDGKLATNVSYVKVGGTAVDTMAFTNTYANTDTAQVTLSGSKSLTGRTLITGEFSFKLVEQGGNYTETVTNRADGSFVFSPITYTADDVGTHTYTITEVNDGKGGIAYDGKSYTVTVKVEDNGEGELVVNTTGADAIAFSNSYSAKPTSATLSGTKTWTNTDLNGAKAMAGGAFNFVLYASNEDYSVQGNEVARTANTANGTFSFQIDYTEAGHYYYLLREVIGEAAGVSYDTGIYRIHIAVYDNGAGQLVATAPEIYKVGTGSSTIAFANYYTPAETSVTISGDKTLTDPNSTGRKLLDGEFDFELYKADASFEATGDALQTVSNVGGKFTFEPITYTKSGTYYYVVKEAVPSGAANNVYDGVKYDTTEFGITVTVTDNGEGKLEAAWAVTKDGSTSELKFVNEYTITIYTSFEITGTKTLTGNKTLEDGMFTFELYDSKGVRVAETSNVGASFTFENVPLTSIGTHTFTVKERNDGLGGITYDTREYTVTVTATDDSKGGLTAGTPVITLNGQSAALTFENTYEVAKTSAQFRAQKILNVLSGNKTLAADMFSFELLDSAGKVLQTKKNLAGGGVLFDAIEYTEPGEHTYTIREAIPNDAVNNVKDGITYDAHTCTVKVVVTDNGDGTMTADVTYEGLPHFTNTYAVTGSTTVDISGEKTLLYKDLEANMFEFELLDASGNRVGEPVKNTADGKFLFNDIKLDSLGTHTFTVKEVKGSLGGMVYDGTTYTVTVAVTDNGKGGMQAGAPVVTRNGVATQLTFTNRYVNTGTGSVTVKGTKTYNKPIGEGQFSFRLTGTNIEPETVYAATDGSFSFTALNYTAKDIGEIYTYTVAEVIPADAVNNVKDGITYDPDEFTFTVAITDDNEGGIIVTKTMNGAAVTGDIQVELQNSYAVVDSENVIISGTKSYEKDLGENKFYFGLFDAAGNQVGEPVTQNADGSFSFPAISFDQDDIRTEPYVYTVKEVNKDKTYVDYDESEYTVSILVEDNGDGTLKVTKTYLKGQDEVDAITFDNDYIPGGSGTVSVSGTKVLGGDRDLKENEFTFILSQVENGTETELQTVKNGDEGVITFDALSYDHKDIGKTYTYTVKEDIPEGAELNSDRVYELDGVIYDSNVFTFTVTVTDDDQGGIIITKALGEQPVSEGIEVVFNNTYEITGKGVLELTGTKALTGGKPLADNMFEFELLDASGSRVGETVKNIGGEFTFTVEYDKDDISADPIVYTVKEVIPEGATENEDGSYTLDNITYPGTEYTVEVTVSDNGTGGIQVEHTVKDASAIEIVNVYTPDDVIVDLNVQKYVENKTESGITPEGFEFTLSYQGEVLATYASDAEGKTSFPVIFSAEDIGSTFNFQIAEINSKKTGVTYDKTVHEIEVVVGQNEDGTLKTTINEAVTDEITVEFTNYYEKPTIPVTGDEFNLILIVGLLLVSSLGLVAVIATRKKKGSAN